jgi:hypothetical protein
MQTIISTVKRPVIFKVEVYSYLLWTEEAVVFKNDFIHHL